MYLFLFFIVGFMIILSTGLGVWGYINNEFSLIVSSMSVIAASISGLVAILVIKKSSDNERPYINIKPNSERINLMQIEIKNEGSKLAVIQRVEANKPIILLHGSSLFEEIKYNVLAPQSSNVYVLFVVGEYEQKNKDFTTNGTIYYKDANNKRYSNNFIFNIEGIGKSATFSQDKQKAYLEVSKIPEKLIKIEKELKKLNQKLTD